MNFDINSRSKFWIKINEDNFVTSIKWKNLINYNLKIDNTLWYKTKQNNYLIKFSDINEEEVQNFIDIINQFIWLEPNKNIEKYFNKDIINYCAACGFNYKILNLELQRTEIGEAENKLKYHYYEILENDYENYMNILINNMIKCYDILDIDRGNMCITTIPIDKTQDKNHKLAYKILLKFKNITNTDIYFFKCNKPSFKDIKLDDKIKEWNKIYAYPKEFDFISECDITNRDILIVDDLYQSGTSIWSYAQYLKSLGARKIYAIVAVKSLSDKDNYYE